ncbi:MAG: hypothetical protein IPJ16_02200 [Bacteroidales bacterium]|nr:hypothetical protein [Bacteroidales bacterium]
MSRLIIIRLSILAIILFSTVTDLSGQERIPLSKSDSILVLKKIYIFNSETKKFDDIDEPYLEEIWNSNKGNAMVLFDKAIRLSIAPINEKMILASYFYKNKDFEKVKFVLSLCKTKIDSTQIFKVMNSYGIKYSDLNIKPELLVKYCKDCKYQ